MDQDVGLNRRHLTVVTVALGVVLVAAAVVLVPWRPLGADVPVAPAPEAFPAEDLQRSRELAGELGPWAAVSRLGQVAFLVGLAVWAVRRVSRRPAGGAGGAAAGWPADRGEKTLVRPGTWRAAARLATAAALATTATTLVSLPVAVRNSRVARRYGIVVQPWPAWWRDIIVTTLLTAAVTALCLVVLGWLWDRAPRSWPYWAAGVAAAGVVAASFVWPVLVTPLFERTHPLPPGPLRTRIERLAQDRGLGRPEILVSDASSRTVAYNAYVAGFGPSRKVVLYDTLVTSASDDEDGVMTIVAHEMGHADRLDVVRGTVLGSLGAALAVLFAARVAGGPGRRLLRRRHAQPGAAVAAGLAAVAVAQVLQLAAAPAVNVVSRRIEARADVYALEATHDPVAFERMTVRMSHVARSRVDPDPWWRSALFGTHPGAAWRVGQARAWAQVHNRDG